MSPQPLPPILHNTAFIHFTYQEVIITTYILASIIWNKLLSVASNGLLCGSDGRHLQCGRPGFDPWVGNILWRRKWHPTPVLLPGESHGWRSVVGYSPWGHKESDTAERTHFTSLHFIVLKELDHMTPSFQWVKTCFIPKISWLS